MPVVGAAMALAACSSGSSTTPTSTSAAHTTVAALGSPVDVWRSAHQSNTVGGAAGYGATVTVDGHSVPQFTGLQEQDGRVVGFHLSFPPGTHLSTAEGLARAQLPTDVEQTASGRGSFGSGAAYCEFVNYRSKDLAGSLGTASTTASNVGVTFYEIENGKSGTSTIRIVNSADVSTKPRVLGQSC